MKLRKNDTEVSLTEIMLQLHPEGGWAVDFADNDQMDGAETLVWERSDIDPPTDAVIQAKRVELNKKVYQDTRKRTYPTVGEQLDMQYWDSINGTTTWKDAIAKVKTDVPKTT